MTNPDQNSRARSGASQSAPASSNNSINSTNSTVQRSQMLYRKWRSQTFHELVGQEAITRTLQNAIAAGRVGHAYLFCGPRGTGKTSTGRLLAKAINCLEPDPHSRPCDRCEACRSISEARALDLIEIDAASNRGIDEVRELRDKINFQPSFLRKKVYIIDEAHMMTEAAFNALLKTLEEPPPHAVFVLATTDPQDIPATVVSRCQRFDFQRIGLEQIVARLAFICGEEGIPVETAALEMVARQSTGSLRDALSLLDQLIVYSAGNVTLHDVQQMLGVMNIEAVADFVDSLSAGDMAGGLEQINRLVQSGTDLKRFNRELVEHLRSLMLLKVNPASRELEDITSEALARLQEQSRDLELTSIIAFLKVFSGVDYNLKVSPYGQLPLELALMECLINREQVSVAPKAVPQNITRPTAIATPARPQPQAVVAPRPAEPIAPPKVAAPVAKPVAPAVPALEMAEALEEYSAKSDPKEAISPAPAKTENHGLELEAVSQAWMRVLKSLDSHSKMTAAVLKEAKPIAVEGNRVSLAFNYTFHYKRISQDAASITMIEDYFSKEVGQTVIVKCLDNSESNPNAPKAATPIGNKAAPAPKNDELTRKAAQLFNARIVD